MADSGEGYIRHLRHPWKKKEQDLREFFGRYEYTDVPVKAFPEGLTYLESKGYAVKVATKEKKQYVTPFASGVSSET